MEHIKITEEPGILTITLNRPEKLNAFVGHMRRDLAEALANIDLPNGEARVWRRDLRNAGKTLQAPDN